jgi:uncharacterized protein YjbI with pentapeptide repeats
MRIKHRYTGSVIYQDDSKTFNETVKNAILAKVDLRDCDLSYCDLRDCDLRGSNLSGSNLRGSNLSGSNLRGSDLRGSDLSGSDLRDCDLRDCDLRGSYGLIYAQMSFTGFGQINRLISLYDINRDGNPIFFCGCFKGTDEELITYIGNGEEKYKESRHFARKTLLEAIKFSNK